MSKDELVVRAAWLHVDSGNKGSYWRIYIWGADKEFIGTRIIVEGLARIYTEAHAEKIRQVREEIHGLQIILDSYVSHGGEAWKRIMAREQAALEDLLKGWREQ